MKKSALKLTIFICAAALVFAPAAFADLITSSTPGAGYQNWVAGDLDQNGIPYFDNSSDDGNQKNVGYYLTNTGSFTGGTAGPGAIPYWGLSGGSFDPNFSFTKTNTGNNAALKIEIAGNAGINEFGWYSTSSPSDLHSIFAGSNSAGATAFFTPSAFYGFYLKGAGDTIYYTQSASNSSDVGNQHFAVFRSAPGSFWIGMEDLSLTTGDKDYNDMVVTVSAVPEPATILLLGTSMMGFAILAHRRKRNA